MNDEAKIRILIVDDQPDNLLVLESILQSPDYALTPAHSGEEALRLMLNSDFAVVVLDVLMPAMNGFETARLIKQRPRSSLVPIIFLTAYGQNELDISEGYTSGGVDFLTKPVDPVILRAKVSNFVELFRQRERLRTLNDQLVDSRRELQDTNSNLESAIATLREVNATLDSFAFSVSHDLRAPLRHADAYSSLLVQQCAERLNNEERKYLDSIRGSVHRMGRMIDDLLAFSRVSRAEFSRKPVDMNALTRDVIAELEESIGNRTVRFDIGPLQSVEGDPAMLRHVLQNLLGNAVKYTRTRPVAEIRISSQSGAASFIEFTVSDNGVGFDMKYSERLFGVFQRLHHESEFEGSGAGLAIVKQIVHRHGGRVYANAKPDGGASFTFVLPERPAKYLRGSHPGETTLYTI